ncbi:hypothetical protein [Halococcus thailandensis]|uniref:hypothetical protein n=1 Tax=Halococcus thailandensis TaxID=335952 RepID=UPI00126924CF|nr:hypothetical protein [Halococcus thailandensis]
MRRGVELVDEDLTSFEPKGGVKFFRDLIWASASDAGIQAEMHVSLNINTPDGGIDAEVDNNFEIEVQKANYSGVILEGKTGYQIKTGSKPSKSDCRKELLNKEGNIKPYIKNVLSEKGNYVYVTFSQLTPKERKERIRAIKEQLNDKDCDYGDIELFAINQLVKYGNRYPGLVYKYSSSEGGGIDIKTWSKRRAIRIPDKFIKTENRFESIQNIRSLLKKSGEEFGNISGCPICRITGTSGLGKSRLVYEAVHHEQFSARVIYADATNFEGSNLATTLEVDEERRAIIILDNCSRTQHRKFRNRYESYDRLSLITISTDSNRVSADLQDEITHLSRDTIKKILDSEFNNVSAQAIDRFASISDGFPEMALLLAERYTEDKDPKSVVEVSDSTVFDRLLIGNESDAPDLRDIKNILTPFAFFDRVHWKHSRTKTAQERQWLMKAFDLESDYSKSKISEVLQYAKNRGILREEQTLSLRTIPLATYLMREEIQEDNRILYLISSESCPDQLQWRFAGRITYMNTFDPVQMWSKNVLRNTEWFGEYGFNSAIGSIFQALSEITPQEALYVLEMYIGPQDRKGLEKIEGRRIILESLRRIAVWEEHFFSAAELLRKLAEAENNNGVLNNSTGIFSELFSSQYGPHPCSVKVSSLC